MTDEITAWVRDVHERAEETIRGQRLLLLTAHDVEMFELATARVQAERIILDEHTPRGVQGGPPYRWTCTVCDHAPVRWDAYITWPCRTVRAVAWGWRAWPGWREEWKP